MTTDFNTWLAATYPKIRLVPLQEEWVEAQEQQNTKFLWPGRGSGQTFIKNLYAEYLQQQ